MGLLSMSMRKSGTYTDPETRAFSLSHEGLMSKSMKPSEFMAEVASFGCMGLIVPDWISCLALPEAAFTCKSGGRLVVNRDDGFGLSCFSCFKAV